jgi:tetratricopeptide (TPR) repeat protein
MNHRPSIFSRADPLKTIGGCLWLAAWLAAPMAARAHADLLALIDGVTKRIATDPTNASLYFLRGELYRAHADWKPAEQDYGHAGQLDPSLAEIELARGKLLFDTGRDAEARTKLDAYLSGHAGDVDALVTRAHVLARMGDRKAAAANLTDAILHSPNARPDYFLERAKLQADEGDYAAAVAGLDEGIKRLGPLVALQLPAVDFECEQRHFDEALKRLEIVAANSQHQENWLIRRGEIESMAGRREQARASFAEALTVIEALPARAKTAPATLELKNRANEALKQFDASQAALPTLAK